MTRYGVGADAFRRGVLQSRLERGDVVSEGGSLQLAERLLCLRRRKGGARLGTGGSAGLSAGLIIVRVAEARQRG